MHFLWSEWRYFAGKTEKRKDDMGIDILELAGLLKAFLFDDSGERMAVSPLLIAGGISLATSIGNAIFGSSSARKQRREQLKELHRQKENNRNWRDRRYNEDATQRADAQRMLRRTNEGIKKRTQAAYGRKAVVGGTDASMATTQRENAKAVGDALGDIVVNAESRKDDIDKDFRQRDQQLAAAEADVNANYEATKRQNVANAATGAINAKGSVMAASAGDASTWAQNGGAAQAQAVAQAQKQAGKAISDFKPTMERTRQNLFGKWDGDSVDIWQHLRKGK